VILSDVMFYPISSHGCGWFSLGGKPLHQKDSFQIKMDSDNVYRKRLRRTLPYRSTEWSSETKENVATECSGKAVAIKHRRGVEKWQALPEKVEVWNGLLTFSKWGPLINKKL